MTTPLVSVAMATRNGAAFLRPQLDSIYAQTWPHLEVAVTDDASSDETRRILEQYHQRHGLRYEIHSEPLGLVKNFERALSLCRGDFVALCDQDDLWKPHKIATLLEQIGAASLIYAVPQEFLSETGELRIDQRNDRWRRFAKAHGSGRPTRFLLAESWVVSHTVLLRRSLIEHALPIPDGQPFHDAWLALVASKLDGLAYTDERLQIYRHHPASLTYIDIASPSRPRRPLARLVAGELTRAWRRRCEVETRRLRGALELPLLDDADRAFVGDLLAYYRSGLEHGRAWSAFAAGRRVAPWMASLWETRGHFRFAARALLGGLPA